MQDRLSKSDTLEHPLGVGLESFPTSMSESDFFENLGLSLFEFFSCEMVEGSIEVEKLISCEVLVEIRILWHES